MDILSDPVFLARLQFAATVAYHFIFVPMSIGLGLILAINETRYYKSHSPEDEAASKFWVKIFTATFAIGVATGITMEFSFGTNWADYSRFVGNIFGAPLAAEALIAFFLESVFLGVLLFGRKKVSPKFYMVSSWLVWVGSCLSALWIIIANSWMQTPAGAELSSDGTQALLTDFFAAAFNATTGVRYAHVVVGLLIMGAFIAMAVSAWYMLKGKHAEFAKKTMKIGCVVAVITTCAMLVTAHATAVKVWEEQPTKMAMMEGMYDNEVPPLYLFGWVDEEAGEVITPISIPGGTSFLATGTFDTEYTGLNELAQTEQYSDIDVESAPVNFVFQSYHLMVAMFGLIALTVALALIFALRGGITKMRWLQKLVVVSPLFPLVAIQAGWFTAEVGRQPWTVYPATSSPDGISLLTENGVSGAVSSPELVVTLLLFLLVYTLLIVGWARVIARFIKEGPVLPEETEEPEPSLFGKPGAARLATEGAHAAHVAQGAGASAAGKAAKATEAAAAGKAGE